MADFSYVKPVYDKTFSHKTISGGNMRVGSLVKHIEWEYIGVVIEQGVSTLRPCWLVHRSDGVVQDRWCSECELEVLCK